ncbi:YcdB/YcdC domain-containing protein [Brevibacillus ginsengisoli]|uniref:YcdB/YcdC domain-containing protein n=1 Tax=Brevibacillus ginsengisoli TaxID=363854 RepID=UPI003CF265E5
MKKMSTIPTMVIVSSLLFVQPVFAEQTPTQGNASTTNVIATVEIPAHIHKLLGDLKEYLPEWERLNLDPEYYHQNVENSLLVLSSPEKNGKSEKNVQINFDSEGQLINYRITLPEAASSLPPSDQLAKERASGFADIVLIENFHVAEETITNEQEGVKTVVLYPSLNHLPVKKKWIEIRVNGDGSILGFTTKFDNKWDESNLALPPNRKTPETIKQAYAKLLNMELQYTAEQGDNDAKLQYVPNYFGPLDAVNGTPLDAIDWQQQTKALQGKGSNLAFHSIDELNRFVANEWGIKSNELTFATSEVKKAGSDTPSVILYSWTPKQYGELKAIIIELEAKTGQLLSAKVEKQYPGKAPSNGLTEQAENQIITAFLERNMNQKVTEVRIKHHLNNYLVQRTVNGIPVNGESWLISTEPTTGKIVGLTIEPINLDRKFPAGKETISTETAKAKLLGEVDWEMCYLYSDEKDDVQLAFVPKGKNIIQNVDAQSKH